MPVESKKVPRNALCLTIGALQLAAQEGEADAAPRAKVSMRARSGQALHHWYWGQLVHDMAGFTPAADRIPIDYCHFDTEVLGYLDSFDAKPEGLDVAGEVISFDGKDRSAEVIHKQKAGIPYQASIYFVPEAIEEVLAGGSAEVNGFTIQGPATIVRKWSCRGVAICPYGYDPDTETKFAARLGGEVDVLVSRKEDSAMSVDNTNPAPANRDQLTAELKKYTDRFGAENGVKWFTDGKSYEQALELHVGVQAEQLAAKEKELGETQQKLGAINRGEESGATFADGEKTKKSLAAMVKIK